jgi:hypothetical protein
LVCLNFPNHDELQLTSRSDGRWRLALDRVKKIVFCTIPAVRIDSHLLLAVVFVDVFIFRSRGPNPHQKTADDCSDECEKRVTGSVQVPNPRRAVLEEATTKLFAHCSTPLPWRRGVPSRHQGRTSKITDPVLAALLAEGKRKSDMATRVRDQNNGISNQIKSYYLGDLGHLREWDAFITVADVAQFRVTDALDRKTGKQDLATQIPAGLRRISSNPSGGKPVNVSSVSPQALWRNVRLKARWFPILW